MYSYEVLCLCTISLNVIFSNNIFSLLLTAHIEENEKNDDIENGIGESGIKFSSDDQLQQHEKEPNNINEIYQTEEAQQEHEEEHNSGFPTGNDCEGYGVF